MKTLLGLILILTISNCSTYTPIIDSKGRAGSWNEARATEITDDIHHCRMLADQHLTSSTEAQAWIITNILRPMSLGVVSVAEDTKKNYVKKCLAGRNHNVIN
jgi:anti-sigma-K factor RskA